MALIVEIPDPGLGNISYLVDLGDGTGLVVDPERDPRPYLEAARIRRLENMSIYISSLDQLYREACPSFLSGRPEALSRPALIIFRSENLGCLLIRVNAV